MPIIILDIIENFFIIWFITTCCGINILKNVIKATVLVILATTFAVLIQNLKIFGTDIDMLINMFLGIFLYVYLIKAFYYRKVKVFKCLIYTLTYFVVFLFGLQILYYPFFANYISKSGFNILIISLPQRLFEIFIILLILHKQRRNYNV